MTWSYATKSRGCSTKVKNVNNKLNNDYNSRNEIKIKEKDGTIYSAKELFSIIENIIRAFNKGIFSYIDGFQVEIETDEETDKEADEEMDTTIIP